MTKLTRIEEVKNKIDAYMGKSSSSNKASKQYDCARQICQLFPQPLDDKELGEALEEGVDKVLLSYETMLACQLTEKLGESRELIKQRGAKLILALLQPKIEHLLDQLKLADKNYLELKNAFDERIEEAKRQKDDEWKERLKQEILGNEVVQLANIKEAKREERERILGAGIIKVTRAGDILQRYWLKRGCDRGAQPDGGIKIDYQAMDENEKQLDIQIQW